MSVSRPPRGRPREWAWRIIPPGSGRRNPQPGQAVNAVTQYTYDPVGNLDTVTLPNGVVEDYDYDGLNRLETLTVTNGQGKKLFEQEYKLLPDGQRDYVIEKRYDGTSQMPFSTVKIDWTYDALGRLVAETRDLDGNGQRDVGDYTDLFAFDLAGNRVLKVRGWDVNGDGVLDGEEIDQATTSTFNARDQLLQESIKGTLAATYSSAVSIGLNVFIPTNMPNWHFPSDL